MNSSEKSKSGNEIPIPAVTVDQKSGKWVASTTHPISIGTVIETEIAALSLRTDPNATAPITAFIELLFERNMTECNSLLRPLSLLGPIDTGRLQVWSPIARRYKRTEQDCIQYEDMLYRNIMEMTSPITQTHLGYAVFPRFSQFLSHSCKPNCTLVYDYEKQDGVQRARCTLLAIRIIPANEPLTITLCDNLPSFPYEARQLLLVEAGLTGVTTDCQCHHCMLERSCLEKKNLEPESKQTCPAVGPRPNRKARRAQAQAQAQVRAQAQAQENNYSQKPQQQVIRNVLQPYRDIFETPVEKLFAQLVRESESMNSHLLQHALFGFLLPPLLSYGFERFVYGLYRNEYGVAEFDKLTSTTARSTLQTYCDRWCSIMMTTRQRVYVSGELTPERCMIFQLAWLMISLECKRLQLRDNVFGTVSILPSLLPENFQREWIRLVRRSESTHSQGSFCLGLFQILSEQWKEGGSKPKKIQSETKTVVFPSSLPASSTTAATALASTASGDENDKNLVIYDKIQELMLYDPQMAAELGQVFYQRLQKQQRPIGAHGRAKTPTTAAGDKR